MITRSANPVTRSSIPVNPVCSGITIHGRAIAHDRRGGEPPGDQDFSCQARAYAAVDRIDWPDGFCRRDIGLNTRR
jgi:hypothetical protein